MLAGLVAGRRGRAGIEVSRSPAIPAVASRWRVASVFPREDWAEGRSAG
jgi:hypothetical protein